LAENFPQAKGRLRTWEGRTIGFLLHFISESAREGVGKLSDNKEKSQRRKPE